MNISASTRCGLAAIALCGLATAGCVMPDQISQMQKDLADVRQQLRRVEQNQQETQQAMADLEARASSEQPITRAELADLSVRVDQATRDGATADERMNDLQRRLERLSTDLQQTRQMTRRFPSSPPTTVEAAEDPMRVAAVDPTAVPADAVPDPDALYKTAYTDFSKGNYALAISGFEEYQQKFPDSALADNAMYWVGESYFSQGNFVEATRGFDRLLETYPSSDKAAAANLKKALAYLEQNQVAQAIVQLRFVISSHGSTDEAKIARDKLTSLGASL